MIRHYSWPCQKYLNAMHNHYTIHNANTDMEASVHIQQVDR